PGLIGLELCFGLLLGLTGKSGLTLARLIDALSTRPARIAQITPPALKEGAVAELTLVDPEASWVPSQIGLRSKSKNTPFLDRELRGRVLMTLADGRLAFDGGIS
ncbi:MAG: dihydroorotase, partial [Myxococcales bacterium]|nr:dihydroorotase [Myxococcales bacterium]